MKTAYRSLSVVSALLLGGAFVAFKGGAFTAVAGEEPRPLPGSKSITIVTDFKGWTPSEGIITTSGFPVPTITIPTIWERYQEPTIIMSSSKSAALFGTTRLPGSIASAGSLKPWEWNRVDSSHWTLPAAWQKQTDTEVRSAK